MPMLSARRMKKRSRSSQSCSASCSRAAAAFSRAGRLRRVRKSIAVLVAVAGRLCAQQPFYTDDSAVTEKGKWHFECFNEYDGLQRPQFPNLRQNTLNYKLNYGLPYNLEVDLDAPYLAIFRAAGDLPRTSTGVGDFNLGLKWNFHQEARAPALSASFY